jgi:WD40 repeat protein
VIPSPYKGLAPFQDTELDALLFFGREREIGIIGANVLASRLTVLYGPSGVGKSSLLRAGVAHRLRARARENVEERGHPEYVVVVHDQWSDDPVAALRLAVRDALAEQFGSALLDETEGEPLTDTFGRWTEALACDLLLVLDQVEEHFLYHQGEGGFTAELPELVTRPGLRVRILLSLRDDALSKLDRFKGRIPNLFANYLRLDHLDRRSARDAVQKPVERYNELAGDSIEVEPELTELVLEQTAAGQVDLGEAGRGLTADDVRTGRIEAAYLQLVLERIWEEEQEAGSNRLRKETLVGLGGAESIVRAHLRRAVEELTSEEKDVAADVFRFLVTPSGTKIAHGADDLAEYASIDQQRLLPVLSTLGRERIVRTVEGAGSNGAQYEIFHDVLGEAVLAWRREQELERERRAAERRHRRLAAVAVGALLALAAMTAVAIYAFSQRSEAQKSERKALARELIARAATRLSVDPLESIDLAARAARLEPTTASETTLRDALVYSRVRAILPAGRGAVNAAAYSPDASLVVTANEDGTARVFSTTTGETLAVLRHRAAVTDAFFSADGKRIVTAGRDGTARLWTATGQPLRRFRHDAAVLDAAMSPDGSVLVTTTEDAVHLWHLKGRESHRVFPDPGHRIAMSRDGRYAAIVGGDRFARVYDLASGQRHFELRHDSQVLSAAFGPRNRMLATGSADWTAQTWDLRRGRPQYRLKGHFERVVDVAVSPQGRYVGTASADGTGRIWDVGTGRGDLVTQLTGHRQQLRTIAFSAKGLHVATSSRDGTARVWKTDRGQPEAVLAGHDGDVRGAVFSRTSRRVLTFGEDGTARLWDPGITPHLRVLAHQRAGFTGLDVASNGRRFVTTDATGAARLWSPGGKSSVLPVGKVREARASPDGKLVATASGDRAAIWTIDGSQRQALPHPTSVLAVAFSPDGELLATAADDSVVRLWRVSDGELDERLPRPDQGRIVDLSFSPDGRRLVGAGTDARARIWNLESGRLERTLSGHRDDLTSAAFSPDGERVVTSSVDHDARVWDAGTGALRRVLSGHGAIVSEARFSADGRWVVTAGPGKAGLWDVDSGQAPSLLTGHSGRLQGAAFAGDGYTILTAGGDDGTIRTFTCEVCGGIPDLLALAERRLSRAGNAQG